MRSRSVAIKLEAECTSLRSMARFKCRAPYFMSVLLCGDSGFVENDAHAPHDQIWSITSHPHAGRKSESLGPGAENTGREMLYFRLSYVNWRMLH